MLLNVEYLQDLLGFLRLSDFCLSDFLNFTIKYDLNKCLSTSLSADNEILDCAIDFFQGDCSSELSLFLIKLLLLIVRG